MQQSPEQHQNDLSFEDAFDRLSDTVKALETGGLTLDKATQLYEEGMKLVKLCNKLLNEAELRITNLRDAFPDQDLFTSPEEEEEGAEA